MKLESGVRVGPYAIVKLIGAGGMGEVYEATDTRLGREVAVKLLPALFATDTERLGRFEQEARATASLNHPSILSVYDVGMHGHTPYLVCELLEGQTLRDRMTEGLIPLSTVIDFAAQIADGLAAAHAKGIIHRDLKPENVFITPGQRIKILDFGLARLAAVPGSTAAPGLVDFTREHTVPNAIIGTLGYMSPEQARGQESDHRSDIFAFGAVLYEMVEGRKPFDGVTPADTLSAIIKDPVADLTSSNDRLVPPALQLIVKRCLDKDPAARFQSAGDLGFVLRSFSSSGGSTAVPLAEVAAPKPRPRWPLAAAAFGIGGLAIAGLMTVIDNPARSGSAATPATEFLLPTPSADVSFAPAPLPGLAPTSPQVGMSPDGRSIAFVVTAANGQRQLWIRALDSSQPRAIAGTEGVSAWPFWSPDSRSIVISTGRALQKVDVASGAIERLATLPKETPAVPFVTGSWGPDGTILLSIGGATGIYRVPASGGALAAVTTLDQQRRDHYHSWPQLLDAGRFLLFVRTDDASTTGAYTGRLGTPEITLVRANPSAAVYANGHLLLATEDRLVAEPFDIATLRATGQPSTLAPSIYVGAGRTASFWASTNGDVVYGIGGSPERQFRWFDVSGTGLGTIGPPGMYVTFDLSPDGTRIVTEVARPGATPRATLATLDTVRGIMTPLTRGEMNDSDPRFGPGGDVVFARNSGDAPGIYKTDPAGGQQTMVFPRGKLPVLWLESWAQDGSSIVYRSGDNPEAWRLPSGASTAERVTDVGTSVDQVQLSPDRRWMVYNAPESEQFEVYVAPVPANGQRWQVSKAGGVQGTWRADGRGVYYLGLDSGLYSVDLTITNGKLSPSSPRLLFRTGVPVISPYVEQYRPSADGRRFLFCLPLTSVQREPLRVLMNWPAKLEAGR